METGRLTAELMWRAALVAALIDVPLVLLVAWRVPSERFGKLQWHLAGAAFVVYAALWGIFGSVFYWEEVYKAIFPAWARWLLPGGYGLLFGLLALAFWRVSHLAKRGGVLWFVLLGGLVSLVGHSIGISRGLLRVPLLREVSAASALTFGVFEFIFYWFVIVGLAVGGRWVEERIRKL